MRGPFVRSIHRLRLLALGAMFVAGCAVESDVPSESIGETGQAATAATSAIVTFLLYDENGNRLSRSGVIARMTNRAGANVLSSGTFDLATLKAVTLNTSSIATNGAWTTTFTKLATVPRQGLMIHWNTTDTGYSSFLLDNGGLGFTANATVNFNQRLALDARRQLNAALATKPAYVPSAAFTAQRAEADACFVRLAAATTEATKGAIGQSCLNSLAVAMTTLTREYGSAVAASMPDERAFWGVTINPSTVQNDDRKLDDLAALFAPQHRWARLEMEEGDNYGLVATLAAHAQSRGIHTLGQLFDSSDEASITLATFKTQVDKVLATPGMDKISAWEVGNEVNGGWTGTQMAPKIEYASTRVKALYPQKMICLTFYWYSMQDTMKSSLFNWIATNVTPTIRNNIDCVTLSIYTDEQPLGFSWDMVMSRLAAEFPGKKVMVGELGFVDPTVKAFYREGPSSLTLEQGAALYIANRYPSAFATPNAVGGGFWWYYDDDMVGKTPLWHALRDTYCGIYPALCAL